MKLFLIGFKFQSEDIPGYVPNGVTVSVHKDETAVHIFFSKVQARAIYKMHRLVGKNIELFHEMISKCALPEESEKEVLALRGTVASELAEVFFDKQSVPEDFEKKLGIFDILGPDHISDEDPYVVLAVNETKERISVHVIASLNQFNEVVASCENVMDPEFITGLLSILHTIGLPQSTLKRAIIIEGFAAQVFGSGFNMRRYRAYLEYQKEKAKIELEQAQKDTGRVYRILACQVVSTEAAKKTNSCTCGILILQNNDGYRFILFYSKHHGIAHTLEARDSRSESRALEVIQNSDLPLSSLFAARVLDGVIASTLVEMYRAQSALDISDEESSHNRQMKPEVRRMYFSRAHEKPAFVFIAVIHSYQDQRLYICTNRKQVLLLYESYAKLFNRKLLSEAKKELKNSTLPETSDQSMVVIDGLFGFNAIRGMRILLARHNAN